MIKGNYGAVIGPKNFITWKIKTELIENASSPANHSAVFPLDHENT
jgi:hypothetical protein